MSSDLVTRLRRSADYAPCCADGSICYEWDGGKLLDEAAAEITRLNAVIAATRKVIEQGYPGQPAKTEQCPHGKFGFEDCITCYDEALLAALSREGEQ